VTIKNFSLAYIIGPWWMSSSVVVADEEDPFSVYMVYGHFRGEEGNLGRKKYNSMMK
jgi:hypothetical protein